MEATLVPKHGYEMEWIRFSGLRGKGLVRMALLPLNLLIAFWQSARVIFRVRPDVVLGMGGYVSFPGGMMASLLNRPLVVHEQNSIAGLANRVLAGVADRILSGFPGVLKKSEWVGNPVRESIARLAPPAERFAGRSGPLKLLVLGGSLGAQALNEVVPQSLALVPEDQRPQVTHQAGAKHLDSLRRNYAKAGVRAQALAFIDDMAAQYAEADLVICRAGALTVSELAAAGVASVLVPFPSCGGRPSDPQRPLSRRRRRRRAGAAARTCARAGSPTCCSGSRATSCWRWPIEHAPWPSPEQRPRWPAYAWRSQHEFQGGEHEPEQEQQAGQASRRTAPVAVARSGARGTPRRAAQDLGDLRLQFLLDASMLPR